MIAKTGTNIITWTAPAYTPVYWLTYFSTDGGITFSNYSTVPGTNTSASVLDLGFLWYIVGVDGTGNPVSLPSNVITV